VYLHLSFVNYLKPTTTHVTTVIHVYNPIYPHSQNISALLYLLQIYSADKMTGTAHTNKKIFLEILTIYTTLSLSFLTAIFQMDLG